MNTKSEEAPGGSSSDHEKSRDKQQDLDQPEDGIMDSTLALRHLVFLCNDLEDSVSTARREFGLNAGVKDPATLGEQGLIHEVLTIDQTFLEFTSPSRDNSEWASLLSTRGDLGLVAIVQVQSIDEAKGRASQRGIKPAAEEVFQNHVLTQWDAEVFGVMTELVEARPATSWFWAPEIFANASTSVVRDVSAIELAAADPDTVANNWAAVLGIPLDRNDCIVDGHGRTIRFTQSTGREGLVGIDLTATDRSRVGYSTTISGVDFVFV